VATVNDTGRSPGDAISHRADASEFLDLEVNHFAGMLALVAPDRLGWLPRGKAVALIERQPVNIGQRSIRSSRSPAPRWPVSLVGFHRLARSPGRQREAATRQTRGYLHCGGRRSAQTDVISQGQK
jgi:hypothetical protein